MIWLVLLILAFIYWNQRNKRHQTITTCRAITAKNEPCSRKPVNDGYCIQHWQRVRARVRMTEILPRDVMEHVLLDYC